MKIKNYLSLAVLGLTTSIVQAQELPKSSSEAFVKQRIGLTDVTITYSRPNVNDREVFGEVVSYDKIWRAGANKSTKITFSDDVTIDEQVLKAGDYAFYLIPSENNKWVVVFNTDADSWGVYNYDETKDVLRIEVDVLENEEVESLSYGFEKVKGDKGELVFEWDNKKISLPITVEVNKKAWINIEKAINETEGEAKAKVYVNAVDYALETNEKLENALVWIDEAIAIKDGWYAHWMKAEVLHALKDDKKAKKEVKYAFKMGEKLEGEKLETFKRYKARIEELVAAW